MTTSLADITSGMTLDQAKALQQQAADYLASVRKKGYDGIVVAAAQGYVNLCDLAIEYIEEQLA